MRSSRVGALRLLIAASLLATLPQVALTQPSRPGLLTGRLTATDGKPVADAVLRATRGGRTVTAYSDTDGDYRLGGLGAGRWTVAIRRLGFAPRVLEIDLPAEGLHRNLTLDRLSSDRDPALVAAGWVGIRGIVGDARREAPLAGAVVKLLGVDITTTSDVLGEFVVRLPRAREIALRVERDGFVSRVVTATVPEGSYVAVEIPLDTALDAALDAWIFRDLDARMKYATPRAAHIGTAELMATESRDLWSALENTATIRRKTIVITRAACLYVNGIARPGVPVDAIFASDVEFVEVYPPGSELTRTLQQAWPAGAACGVRDNSAMRFGSSRQTAQFISVWQRVP